MAKILIADDSASIRSLVKMTLEGASHVVVEADNGRSALEKARLQDFDLVLTDINMPMMNGIDLAKNLHAMSKYKGKPILVLSTESSREMKDRGRAAGVTAWMVKPFEPQTLLKTIARVL
jgi:two-component system chemotaxis response regulator CheY